MQGQQATGRHQSRENSTWTQAENNVHHRGGETLQQGCSELVGMFFKTCWSDMTSL